MKAKSIPLRKCTGCQEMKDKRTLVRVVKNEDEFSIDFTGKKPGRGAYICSDLECLEKAKKSNGISVLIAREEAYAFTMGGVYDADDVILKVGENYERAEATYEDAFFLPVIPENTECIKYTINNYDLRFILIDGTLSAVTLTNPENWDLE